MPTVSAADLAALRDQFQWSRFYLGVLVPATVHSSQINYASIPRGTVAIPFDGGAYGTGFAAGSVVAGMTLWVGTTANSHDICKLRIRTPYDRTCTAGNAFVSGDGGVTGTITVCEHNYLLRDNYYLTVKEEFRLWPKHAIAVQGGLTVLRYNDYDIQYCGQNKDANRDPIVRMGPPGVAIRDSDGNATINFWSNSGAAPGGGAPGSYAWTWRGGTPASAATAGTAASPHSVVWTTPGFYLATLTLDGSVTGYRPVFVYDSIDTNHMPYEDFEVQNVSGDFSTGGWNLSVRVKEDCSVDDFPEESMIILWAEDWYKGSQVSIGGNYRHRENLIFVGYIIKGTVRKDPFTDDVLFEAHTIDGEMKGCEQFPLSVEDDPNANDNWLQIEDMTVDKVAYFIAKEQSTLLDITDVHFSGDTKMVRWFDIAQKSLYEQLDKDCYDSAILGRCLSDRMGIVRCEINPQFLDVGADRNAIDTIMDIQAQDWVNEISLPNPQVPRCSLVDLSAGYYAGGLADVELIFSLAHGDVPMERGRSTQLDNLIGTSQNQCNRVAGNYLANQNNPYPGISVPIGLNYRVFDIVPQEWVTMSLTPADTYRAVEWTDERLIPRRIDFNLNNALGTVSARLELEMESSGTAGVAGYYPTEPPEETYVPPSTPVEPPYTPGTDDSWEGIVFCATDDGVARCDDITATPAVWTAINTGLTGNAQDVYGMRIVTQTDEGVIVTKNGVYLGTDISTASASWTQILSVAEASALAGVTVEFCTTWGYFAGDLHEAHHPVMSWYLDPGYVGVFVQRNDGTAYDEYTKYYLHTHDYGTDGWASSGALHSGLGVAWNEGIEYIHAAYYSWAVSGRLHVIARNPKGAGSIAYIYSTDRGTAGTWNAGNTYNFSTISGARIGRPSVYKPSGVFNTNDQWVVATDYQAAAGVGAVKRATTGWNTAAWTSIGAAGMQGYTYLTLHPADPNYMMAACNTAAGTNELVYVSTTAGASWTLGWSIANGFNVARIARNPYGKDDWIMGLASALAGAYVYYTDDFLTTSPPTDKTGNLVAQLPAMTRVTELRTY